MRVISRNSAAGVRSPAQRQTHENRRLGAERIYWFAADSAAGSGASAPDINTVGFAHGNDMRVHRAGCPFAVAAQDRDDDLLMLHMRLRQPAERAKLRAAERLDPRPCRQREFRKILIVRTSM